MKKKCYSIDDYATEILEMRLVDKMQDEQHLIDIFDLEQKRKQLRIMKCDIFDNPTQYLIKSLKAKRFGIECEICGKSFLICEENLYKSHRYICPKCKKNIEISK